MTTPIEVRTTRTVGDVLNTTFRFIKQNAATLFKALLFFVFPFMALTNILNGINLARSPSIMEMMENPTAASGQTANPLLWVGIIAASTVATLIASGVVYGYVRLYRENGPDGVTLSNVWRQARSHFLPFLGVMLLLGGLFFVSAVINMIPVAGFLVWIMGWIYVGVSVSLALVVTLEERPGIWASIKRSYQLVKGHWWQTFGVLAVATILTAILGILFGIPMQVLALTGTSDGGVGIAVIAAGALAAIGNALLYSIPLVATSLQYYNLVEMEEHVGLEEEVEALEEK